MGLIDGVLGHFVDLLELLLGTRRWLRLGWRCRSSRSRAVILLIRYASLAALRRRYHCH